MDEITYVKRPREYYACRIRWLDESKHFNDVVAKDLCLVLPNGKRIYAAHYTDVLVHDPVIDKYCLIESGKFDSMFMMSVEDYVDEQLDNHVECWH